MKNRIINGAMVIDQRNAGASVTVPATTNIFPVDRFYFYTAQASKLTGQQYSPTTSGYVTPPAGFTNYLGITSSSAYTSLSTDYFQLRHVIEGFNIADLGWGTANAKTVTLSFWVYSSLTGQFGGAIRNNSNYTHTYPFSFNISAANTWQQVTVTIVGPNASQGTWSTNNNAGLEVVFNLGSGSTFLSTAGSWQSGTYCGVTGDNKLVGTNGATLYITGMQLEVGSYATGYEYRQYGQELALCQRYLESGYCDTVGGYISGAGVSIGAWIPFEVAKRVNTGMSITVSTGTTYSSATGTWTSQASGGGTTARTVGINSQYNNGWNTAWSGSDPRIFGYWWISAEL
jgi:hypothetical protein